MKRLAERSIVLAAPLAPGSAVNRARILFLIASGISFLSSVFLWFLGHKEQGLFVGLWVPSILALGSLMLAGRGRAGA